MILQAIKTYWHLQDEFTKNKWTYFHTALSVKTFPFIKYKNKLPHDRRVMSASRNLVLSSVFSSMTAKEKNSQKLVSWLHDSNSYILHWKEGRESESLNDSVLLIRQPVCLLNTRSAQWGPSGTEDKAAPYCVMEKWQPTTKAGDGWQ